MYEVETKTEIKNMIYEVRGKQVMLDSDLAKLYGCRNGTKAINLAVKRNMVRFPNNFYFQLTKEEYAKIIEKNKILRFQIETLEENINLTGKHKKYLPYVFTEQGLQGKKENEFTTKIFPQKTNKKFIKTIAQ